MSAFFRRECADTRVSLSGDTGLGTSGAFLKGITVYFQKKQMH